MASAIYGIAGILQGCANHQRHVHSLVGGALRGHICIDANPFRSRAQILDMTLRPARFEHGRSKAPLALLAIFLTLLAEPKYEQLFMQRRGCNLLL